LLLSIVQKLKKYFTTEKKGHPPVNTEIAAPEPAPATARPTRRGRRRKPGGKTQPPVPSTTVEEPSWDPSHFRVEPVPDRTRFHDLNLPPAIMRGIQGLGFEYCTPIQAELLPSLIAGRDAFGKAQTGTGKSAAFLIAVLNRLLRFPVGSDRRASSPRALILAPTRELTIQIHRDAVDLGKYCPTRIVAVYGGIDYENQKQMLRKEAVDVLIATPGRLLDFCRQRIISLDQVEVLVIDEADRLLDMGFIPDVSKIIQQTPAREKRQTLLFSATLTPEISRLAGQWTKEPISVEIEPERVAAASVDQIVYLATSEEKLMVLYNLITGGNLERVIVFCNRRDITREIRDKLQQYGINCAMLSGEVPQDKRMRTLENFKNGRIRVLVATDVAGRGLHIEGVSHVINYNLPHDAEDYVHRIGRTGRAGATGTSVSFADESESFYLPQIEEYMGQKLSCIYPDESLLQPLPPLPPAVDRKPVVRKAGPARGRIRRDRTGGLRKPRR
jgi:ATP-dependent RNA helicase RhlB